MGEDVPGSESECCSDPLSWSAGPTNRAVPDPGAVPCRSGVIARSRRSSVRILLGVPAQAGTERGCVSPPLSLGLLTMPMPLVRSGRRQARTSDEASSRQRSGRQDLRLP